MARPKLTVALAAMVVAGTVAAAWPMSPSDAAETTGSWQRALAFWDVIGVGPHERSIELAYRIGGCGPRNVQATTQEMAKSITIQVSEEILTGPEVNCPAIAGVGSLRVSLSRPLAGRLIAGRPTYSPLETPRRLFGLFRTTTPTLIGFSPADAEQVLAIYGVKPKIRFVARSHGLPRVVAQKPRPEVPLPTHHTEEIWVSR